MKVISPDTFVPVISQRMEWPWYLTSIDLRISFIEEQLDYFGGHMFDRKEGPPGKLVAGGAHCEWKQANGVSEQS